MGQRSVWWLGWVLALLLVGASPLSARDDGYVIGKGDVLSVVIFAGGTTQESLDLTVSSKGTIHFPFLGEVPAAGMTVAQLTDQVAGTLARDYFVNPQVIISIKDYKSKRVYVTGAIERPGIYPLEGPTTLLRIIAEAGGVTKERGDFAYIIRASMQEFQQNTDITNLLQQKRAVQVNLRLLLDQGAVEENVALEADDVVYIPPTSFSNATQYKVYVLGKVKNPGAYDFQPGLTALDACILAGGFDKYAAPNRTLITRRTTGGDQETHKINLDRVRKGKDKDFPLQAGDRIFVPESWL